VLPVENRGLKRKQLKSFRQSLFFRRVTLVRGDKGLGIAITSKNEQSHPPNSNGVFIESVSDNTSIDGEECVKVGDQIVEINGVSYVNESYQATLKALKESGSMVELVLRSALAKPSHDRRETVS
jgi:C-terminal processing protease CtpA/Prc